MADNITLNSGSGGATLAADDVSSVWYQQVKLVDGTLNSTTAIAAGGGVEAGALRVTIASDSTGVLSVDDNGGSLTIDGTVTANLSATDNAVLDTIDAVLDTINAKLASGTVIGDVNLGATDNAVLDSIVANTNNLNNCIVQDDAPFTPATGYLMMIGGEYDDAGTDSVDEGDAGNIRISANRNIYVQLRDAAGNERGLNIDASGNLTANITGTVTVGSHAVTNAGTFATQIDGAALTALQLIDNSIFADDAAFTLASSSVTMAGAIRDDTLSTLSAVEGDAVPLRVSSTGALHVTGAGGGTQYNIDDAGGATDTGTLALAIRDDSLTTLTPVDGDYVGLRVNSTGALHVTGGGGGTEYTEDVATANPIVGTATLMERDDALTTVTPIEGDWIGLRGSAEGALWVQDFNSDAILADTNTIAGDTTSIDGKITACNTGAVVISSGTVTTVSTVTAVTDITNTIDSTISGAALTALQLIDDAIYTDDAAITLGTSKGMAIMGFAGTQSVNANDAGFLAMETDGSLHIHDGGNSITVDNGGTFATQATLQANSGVDIGDVDVTSIVPGTGATNLGKAIDTAVGSTDTGTGSLFVRDDEQAAITPADGDWTYGTVDKFGKQKMTLHPDATSEPKRAVIDAASSGDNTLVAAAGAGIKIRVTSAFLVAAGTVNTRFESGAAGTALTGQMNLVANTGYVLPFNPDGWFETADNTLLNLELSAAVSVDGCLTYVEV